MLSQVVSPQELVPGFLGEINMNDKYHVLLSPARGTQRPLGHLLACAAIFTHLLTVFDLFSPFSYIIASLFAAQPYIVTARVGSWGGKNEIR